MGRSIRSIKKKHRNFSISSKENNLEVNGDTTEYTVLSRDQNAGRSHNFRIGNISLEKVAECKYLGTNLKNGNYIE